MPRYFLDFLHKNDSFICWGKALPVSSTNVEIMARQSSSEIRLQIPGRSSSRRRMYFKTKSMLSVWREDPVWAAWDKSVLELIEPPPPGSGKPWSDFNKLSKLSDMLEEQNTKFSTFSDLLMSSFYSCSLVVLYLLIISAISASAFEKHYRKDFFKISRNLLAI